MTTAAVIPWSQLAPERRYEVELSTNGFRIRGLDRNAVDVTLERTCWIARSHGQSARYGLVEFRGLNQWITKAVLRGSAGLWYEERAGCTPGWYVKMTARVLNARIYPLWLKMIADADSRVLAVQRHFFAASFRYIPAVLLADELYRHQYLVSDISRYKAAAIAAACVEGLSQRVPWIAERYPYAAQRQRARQTWLDNMGASKPSELNADDPRSIELNVDLLKHWPALFAPQGKPYTSLNKTLMQLPGGITPGVLVGLGDVVLERPIVDRLELITVSTGAQCRRRHHDRIFAHAQHSEIVRAMAMVSDDRNRGVPPVVRRHSDLSPRRTRDIAFFTRYLSDYPDLHNGRIVGLAQKAVEWHRDQAAQGIRKTIDVLGENRQTAIPPIALPDLDGVRFLKTAGEIGEEAEQMRHCVASYAQDAVNGSCYLFHVERAGEVATVEVDQLGRVIQSQGPRNCHNGAASWGREVLAAWGRTFPPIQCRTPRATEEPF
jgi:hypothetical protein